MAISARAIPALGSPSPTALPTRTPQAEPSPNANPNVTLWTEKTIWNACATSSPNRVDSAIRIEKPASSSPEAIAGTIPNTASATIPAGTPRHAARSSRRTPRSFARGTLSAAAIIPTAPRPEAIAVAVAAPTAPIAGRPRCPPDIAQASSALSGRIERFTTATRRGRLTPSKKKLAATIINCGG